MTTTSADKEGLDIGAPKPESSPFVIPARNSTAIQIRPPQTQHLKDKRSRAVSPKKGRSLSPKKAGHDEASASTCTPSPTFGIPPAKHDDDPDVAAKIALSTKTVSETSNLDVYAASYVPLWLRAVNESVAVPRFCSPLKTINFREYVNSFAGSQYLQPLAAVNLPAIQTVPVVHSASPESLTPENYAAYFGEALQNEVAAQATELRSSNVFAAVLEPQDPGQYLFRVKVHGIRENLPRIEVGDVVLLRPLLHRADAPELTNRWAAPGGARERGLCAPGFVGLEFNAVVWGVARPKEEVLLRVDGLMQLSCNIMFAVQEHRITPIARSIACTADSLRVPRSPAVKASWLDRMLFPTPSDGVLQLSLPKGTFPHISWFDTQLNYEQQKAIHAVLDSSYGNVAYLVFGPPGSGKSKTIVETTMQLLQKSQHLARGHRDTHQAPHILLCAPSDSAADTLASRLASRLTPAELFRLNGWSRSFPEVPGRLLPYSYVDNELFSLPSFDTLMSYKVVVTTCRDADMLVQARLTNQDLSHLAGSALRAVAPRAYEALPESQLLHWTALLIDEAAQATEPDALIPLTVVAPPLEAQAGNQDLSYLPQIVMAGDEHQLGPRLCSGTSSALSTSLFARLFSRAFYREHPLSRQRGSKRLTASMLPINRPAFTNLVRNYRSHPAILSVPSRIFYNDTLIPECTALSDIIRTWPGWKSPYSWPVLFVQNTTLDTVESVLIGNGTGAGALFNQGEALNALQLVQRLLQHRAPDHEASEQIRQDEIAVMSPFRAQVHLLRKLFRETGLYDVNIGPLEAFQGLESRIVVLCTTRTRRGTVEQGGAKFVREDRDRGLGVIGQPKRFNMAVTRAKEGLVVLGDPETLTVEGDPCWKAFVSFCARNSCLVHESKGQSLNPDWAEKLAKDGGVKEGRLERALVFAADLMSREITSKEHKRFGYPDSPETRRQKKFSLKGQLLTTDEEMWRTGLQMADEIAESAMLEDEDVDQRPENGQQEDPDPWNSARYRASGNGDLVGPETRTESAADGSPSLTTIPAKERIEDSRVFSTASAREFDRDPKAEFERTDCATQ